MPPERSLRFLLWLVATGFFMQTLDSTIVNTALPAMAVSLGERPLRMQSVVIAYALTMAMLIPASGWIADRHGLRRAFMAAIVLFAIGSGLCAASRTLVELTAARVVQGARYTTTYCPGVGMVLLEATALGNQARAELKSYGMPVKVE